MKHLGAMSEAGEGRNRWHILHFWQQMALLADSEM